MQDLTCPDRIERGGRKVGRDEGREGGREGGGRGRAQGTDDYYIYNHAHVLSVVKQH